MRILTLAALLCATATAAEAQFAYPQPAPRADYGGGLIEMMMTGRDPGLRGSRPGPMTGPIRQAPGPDAFVDPFADPGPAGRRRLAGLPSGPIEAIRREPDPRYARQVVGFDGSEAPGSIIVDTPQRFLYLVQPGRQAIRYGIGVGRPGFEWAGVKTVTRKAEWPSWTPPSEMLRRRPDLPRFMTGGLDNPLGARALYLGSSLYRIHGTNEPETIGTNVSSGCIRMLNDDVVDLYGRVGVGTRVKVI